MPRTIREERPKIFWKENDLVVCKRFDGKYQLCHKKNGKYFYTPIIDKTVEAVVGRKDEYQS